MYGRSPLHCTSFVFWCLVIFASWFERPNHRQVEKGMEEGGEDDNDNDNGTNNDDDDEEEAAEEERTSFAFLGVVSKRFTLSCMDTPSVELQLLTCMFSDLFLDLFWDLSWGLDIRH